METTQGVLNLYKKRGETPLECLNRYRAAHPEYKYTKMTYAGRLDPLAEGVLLVLYGEEIKNKEKYLNLDKEYEFEMVLGVETDSFDILGKITNYELKITNLNVEDINEALKNFVGKRIQEYPPYSSRTVKGKPLFEWAKEDRLGEIEMPKREVEIYDLKLLGKKNMTKSRFEKLVFDSTSIVQGDFRQNEIRKSWVNFFQKSNKKRFIVLKLIISSSRGTYVRSVINTLGKQLETGAIASHIKRIRVGNYSQNRGWDFSC